MRQDAFRKINGPFVCITGETAGSQDGSQTWSQDVCMWLQDDHSKRSTKTAALSTTLYFYISCSHLCYKLLHFILLGLKNYVK